MLIQNLANTGLLELLVNQVSDFILVLCDTEGCFRSWHPGVLSNLGYSFEEFVGCSWDLIYPPGAHNGAIEEEVRAAKELGCATNTRQFVRKNSETFWATTATVALRDSAGVLLGFGKTIGGIPGRHAAEVTSGDASHTGMAAHLRMQQELETANDRLKRMASELERSNEELEEFARIASHDLSAPIISTRWLVDLLFTNYGHQLDEDGRKCLQQISMGLERMADLVDAILTHAQVGMSAIGSLENTDADEALAISLENLRHDIETSGAVILHEPLPPLPVQSQPLTQLFQNLLSNAIKYRQAGLETLVKVTAERIGSDWRISVQDNGIGIEPEWTERIFLPLQRRHGIQIAGSGIGLATCKKIVTRAGGKIWVESRLGLGSTFHFTFPAVQHALGTDA